MSLDKAIEHNKEKRKPYRKSKVFDRTCRNHGSCGYCEGNRTHSNKQNSQSARDELNDYLDPAYQDEIEDRYFMEQRLLQQESDNLLEYYEEEKYDIRSGDELL